MDKTLLLITMEKLKQRKLESFNKNEIGNLSEVKGGKKIATGSGTMYVGGEKVCYQSDIYRDRWLLQDKIVYRHLHNC